MGRSYIPNNDKKNVSAWFDANVAGSQVLDALCEAIEFGSYKEYPTLKDSDGNPIKRFVPRFAEVTEEECKAAARRIWEMPAEQGRKLYADYKDCIEGDEFAFAQYLDDFADFLNKCGGFDCI